MPSILERLEKKALLTAEKEILALHEELKVREAIRDGEVTGDTNRRTCMFCKHRVICRFSRQFSHLKSDFQFTMRKGKANGYAWEGDEKILELFIEQCDYYELDPDE